MIFDLLNLIALSVEITGKTPDKMESDDLWVLLADERFIATLRKLFG